MYETNQEYKFIRPTDSEIQGASSNRKTSKQILEILNKNLKEQSDFEYQKQLNTKNAIRIVLLIDVLLDKFDKRRLMSIYYNYKDNLDFHFDNTDEWKK